MEDHGNVSSIIQGLMLVMSHPELEKTERGGLSPASEALYVDIPLTCGEWMNHYKVEAWRGIMQRYLGQAFALASGIYNMDKKIRGTAWRFLVANHAFGAVRVGTVR